MFRLFSKNGKAERVSPERKKVLKKVCHELGIKVRHYEILDRALTHTSWIDRSSEYNKTYERLEFLGDSILNASVAFLLFQNNPDMT